MVHWDEEHFEQPHPLAVEKPTAAVQEDTLPEMEAVREKSGISFLFFQIAAALLLCAGAVLLHTFYPDFYRNMRSDLGQTLAVFIDFEEQREQLSEVMNDLIGKIKLEPKNTPALSSAPESMPESGAVSSAPVSQPAGSELKT